MGTFDRFGDWCISENINMHLMFYKYEELNQEKVLLNLREMYTADSLLEIFYFRLSMILIIQT